MHLWETDADRLLDARLPSFFSCLVCFWFLLFSFFCFLSFGFFRSLSASFGLLLLSWPERLRACLGLSWGSVWGGFRSTRTPGISLPRDWNLHFQPFEPKQQTRTFAQEHSGSDSAISGEPYSTQKLDPFSLATMSAVRKNPYGAL